MSVDITAWLLDIDTFSGLEGCGTQIAKAMKILPCRHWIIHFIHQNLRGLHAVGILYNRHLDYHLGLNVATIL
jgi:hypothetical protein